jgi:hypothetical protein
MNEVDPNYRNDLPLLPTGEQTTWIWLFLKSRSSRRRRPEDVLDIFRGSRPEGADLARVYRQRGNIDFERTAVMGYLPREVTVLRTNKTQLSGILS